MFPMSTPPVRPGVYKVMVQFRSEAGATQFYSKWTGSSWRSFSSSVEGAERAHRASIWAIDFSKGWIGLTKEAK